MNVLVTGGAGFIGSALAQALIEQGHAVRVLDNLLTGREEVVPSEAHFLKCDIRELEAITAASQGIDIIFHQAAFKSVPKSIDDPFLAETCNGLGTLNVLLAAKRQGVRRVIYASSSSVYGESEGIKHEGMLTNPLSPYAVSKLAGEHYCRVWALINGISTVSLRYFNVFGPGQHADSKYAAVFPAFISALHHRLPPQIHGDGEQTRSFTFIEDVVRANLLAMEADDRVDGQVMNICSKYPKTVNQVLEAVSDAMGTAINPVHLPRRRGDVTHSRGSIARAKSLLNWSPQADWKHSVERTVEWFVERTNL
jgi:nucleoside-diphosphate-sugar epimerase